MKRRNLQHMLRPANLAGAALVAMFFLIAALAPVLAPPENPDNPAPYKAVGERFDRMPHPPSAESPLGTTPRRLDVIFRGLARLEPDNSTPKPQLDIYYTVIWGARSALRREAGIKTVIIPEENEKDLADIPKNIKKQLDIKPVRWIDQVLEVALANPPQPQVDPPPAEADAAAARAH